VTWLLALWLIQPTHELCSACHTAQVDDFKTHAHFAKGLSCDACHGPSVKHRTTTGNAPPDRVAAPDEVPALCGTCHATQRKDYTQSRHAKLVAERSKVRSANCATCHGVHAARKPAAILTQCARCHSSLPATCNTQSGCMSCHQKHSMLAKK
jgi:cytochrome c3-like protein